MVCGFGERKYHNSIEVLGARVNEKGQVSWVSTTWYIFEPENLTPRYRTLVAPLKSGLLVCGGQTYTALSDGIIIDTSTKTVTSSFEQKEMRLAGLCSGQMTPQGKVVALAFNGNGRKVQAVVFDETAKRF